MKVINSLPIISCSFSLVYLRNLLKRSTCKTAYFFVYFCEYETSPPKLLLLHCKQINRIKHEVDGYHQVCKFASKFLIIRQPLLRCISCFYNLDLHHFHLGFKLLEKINKTFIASTFYLQPLNKDNLSRSKHYDHTRSTSISHEKSHRNWGVFAS